MWTDNNNNINIMLLHDDSLVIHTARTLANIFNDSWDSGGQPTLNPFLF